MNSDDLTALDATAQAALVAAGEVSPRELMTATVARIERLEPTVNALASWDPQRAVERAATTMGGPFAGVPFLVKDLVAIPGHRCAMGSRLFAAHVPAEATPYSQALDEAGLQVIGKTTTSELGLLGSTETLVAGITKNPWDLTRSAGGSSGGAAAAVACRMVPIAHASDGGGSIRIPAAMNGVFGFKPGPGRVAASGPHDMFGLLVDHAVSWSVRDSARLLAATERQSDDRIGFVASPRKERLRIGVYGSTLMGAAADPIVEQQLERAVVLCRDLGHEVEHCAPPEIDGAGIGDAFFTMAGATVAQVSAMMQPMLGRLPGDGELEPFTLALRTWFHTLGDDAVPRAMATFEAAAIAMHERAAAYDVLLSPTTPIALWPLGSLAPDLPRETLLERTERLAGYTPIHNIAKLPAMSVPLFTDDDGLPLGTHFAASRGGEATLLALAYEFEEALPWRERWARLPG